MKKNKILMFFLLVLLIPYTLTFAVSNSVKSQEDYELVLDTIRRFNIIMDNFGTEEQKNSFLKIKDNFQSASERHYARDFIQQYTFTDEEDAPPKQDNYQSSVDMFYNLKIELIDLMSKMCETYVERTKNILDSTSKEAFNIVIEYGKNSGMSKYFYRPVDPQNDKKPYDSSKFYYFRERETIERYLNNGYKYLQMSKNIYAQPDFAYIQQKKIKTSAELNFIMKKYMEIIQTSRQGKQYGIEIYRIINRFKLDGILKKYNINDRTVSQYPIYDDRIKEEYKIDAIDNLEMKYSFEKNRSGVEVKK